MIRGEVIRVRLHRFRDFLALSVPVVSDGGSATPFENETVYLSVAHVRQLAEECQRFLAQAGERFSASTFPTVDLCGAKGEQ